MIHRLIGLVLIAVAVIVGLSYYLSPDDLKDCPRPGSEQCQKAGAIIVISGGDTEARTAEAVKLYQAGWAPTIILSGAAADKSGPSNAAAMRKQAEGPLREKESMFSTMRAARLLEFWMESSMRRHPLRSRYSHSCSMLDSSWGLSSPEYIDLAAEVLRVLSDPTRME